MNQYKQVYSNTVPMSVVHINGAANLHLFHCFFCFCALLEHVNMRCIYLVLLFVGGACAERYLMGGDVHFFCARGASG